MRLNLRDAVAALMMGAVLTPYAAMLVRGRVPFVENVATVAAVTLVTAFGIFVVAGGITVRTRIGRVEIGSAVAALMLGVLTIALGGTPSGQLLLAAFVAMVLLTWGLQLLDHAGYLQDPPAGGTRRPPP